jgi:hypothetical protein
MKEKESSKFKSRKRAFDVFFTIFCLAGAAAGLWLFWTDLNHVLIKRSGRPIGTVTYKRRAVQRRFEDRLIWSQLPKESPVYNGDLVRTSDFSDATIHFVSRDSIDLAENSLVHILFDEATGAPRIELVGGELNLSSESGKAVIFSGGREMRPETGGVLVVSGGEAGTEMRAVSGHTEVISPGGSYGLDAGMSANAAVEGPLEIADTFNVLRPAPVEEIQADSGAVNFSWTGVDASSDKYVRIEIATDRRFSSIAYSSDVYGAVEASVPLAPGVWWWRAFLCENGSAAPLPGGDGRPASPAAASEIWSGRLTILQPPEPQTAEQNLELSSPLVLAVLSSEAPVSGVQLRPAQEPEAEEPPPVEPDPEPAVLAEPPQPEPLPEPAVLAEPPRPEPLPEPPRPVEAQLISLLPRLVGLYPPDSTVIDGASLKKSPRIVFSWNTAEGANAYVCTIRQGGLINFNLVREPYLVFDQLGALQNGECVWQVEAVLLADNGNIQRRGEIAESRFTLSVPKPDAPLVNNPGIIYGR